MVGKAGRAKPVSLVEQTVKRADRDSPKGRPHCNEESPPEHPVPRDRDPGEGVALADVPEHFFDPDQRNDFVSGCGGREAALRRISSREDGILAFYRQRVAKQPGEAGARAREAERVSRLGQSMVADFLARWIGGEFVMTGLQPPSIDRGVIPAELGEQLTLNLAERTAEGGGYDFVQVRAIKAANRVPPKVEIVERIAAWLSERRRRRGEELKKVLLDAARGAFPDECKTRAFDAAYRQVYRRNQGRPRGSAHR